ncbi:MAG: ABC transporter substrate-binding protein [Anaerolineaceae bacterium]|nr:ABC transporter substrate-binding protein [Anaerolineaceae bacterium]
MKKYWVLNVLIALAILLAGCAAPAATEAPAAKPTVESSAATADTAPTEAPAAPEPTADLKPIKLGLCLPLTGTLASLGESYVLGIDMAMDEIGGMIEGHPIEIYKADNKANATDAVSAVRKLVEVDEVDVMIGCGSSSATLPAVPIIDELETPTVEASSTNAFVYMQIGKGGNEWFFKINPDDLIMGQGFAEYIAGKTKKIAIVGNDNQMARGAGVVYTNQFKRLGVDVVSEEYFEGSTADYRPVLTKIKNSDAEAMLVFMDDQSCSTFMRQKYEVGLDLPMFSRGSCVSDLVNELLKDNTKIAEGVTEFSFFSADQDKEFSKKFIEFHNKPVTLERMSGYYAFMYTVVPAIKDVIAAGKEINRANIRDAIAALDLDTPAGKIKFDEYNQGYLDGSLEINKDGRATVLETVELKPVDHSDYIVK